MAMAVSTLVELALVIKCHIIGLYMGRLVSTWRPAQKVVLKPSCNVHRHLQKSETRPSDKFLIYTLPYFY